MFLEKSKRDKDLKLLNAPLVVAYSTREKPVGEINGINKDFHLTYAPVNASEHVYLNGLLQEYGEEHDYILSENHLIFCSPPHSGDKITVTYRFQF